MTVKLLKVCTKISPRNGDYWIAWSVLVKSEAFHGSKKKYFDIYCKYGKKGGFDGRVESWIMKVSKPGQDVWSKSGNHRVPGLLPRAVMYLEGKYGG